MSNILKVTTPLTGYDNNIIRPGQAQQQEVSNVHAPVTPEKVVRPDGRNDAGSDTQAQMKLNYESNFNNFVRLLKESPDSVEELALIFREKMSAFAKEGFAAEGSGILAEFFSRIGVKEADMTGYVQEQVEMSLRFKGPFFDLIRQVFRETTSVELKSGILDFLRRYADMASGDHILQTIENALKQCQERMFSGPAAELGKLLEQLKELNANPAAKEETAQAQNPARQEAAAKEETAQAQNPARQEAAAKEETAQAQNPARQEAAAKEETAQAQNPARQEAAAKEETAQAQNPARQEAAAKEETAQAQNPARQEAAAKEETAQAQNPARQEAAAKEETAQAQNPARQESAREGNAAREGTAPNDAEQNKPTQRGQQESRAFLKGETEQNAALLKDRVLPYLNKYISATHDRGSLRNITVQMAYQLSRYENGSMEGLKNVFQRLLGYSDFQKAFGELDPQMLEVVLRRAADDSEKADISKGIMQMIHSDLKGEGGVERKQVIQNFINNALLNESVYMPILHLMLPMVVDGRMLYSELWVDPDAQDGRDSEDEARAVKMLVKFDIEDVGFFDLFFLYRDGKMDLQLDYPDEYRERDAEIRRNVVRILSDNNIRVENFVTGSSKESIPLSEAFPKLVERRNAVNVRV